MNANLSGRIYTIDRSIRTAIRIVVPICFLLLIGASFDLPCKRILTNALVVAAIICGVLILCRICLSPFVKSDEQEEFEEKLDYVLAQRKESQHSQTAASEAYSPLQNLSQEQEKKVKQLLRSLPANERKPEAIKLALVVQYLKALENMNKANLSDLYRLRIWVISITEKEVPDSSQFNEAVRECATSKVSKAQKDLARILQ